MCNPIYGNNLGLIIWFFFVDALTVCAKDETYGRGSKILFTRAKSRYGVSNSTWSTVANSGTFKCEKACLYLIAGHLTIDTKTYVEFQTYKNKAVLLALLSSAITGTVW